MITEIFPSKILIEDFDKPQDWTDELKSIVKTVFANEEAAGRKFDDITENSLPLFTEENEKAFPILTEVKQMFIDGFYKLATSFEEYEEQVGPCQLSYDDITRKVSRETGRLPFMRNGDFKSVHNHLGAQAFGIFYLEDVDNEGEGGELVLRDPSFNSNMGFSANNRYKVQTKQNRLVIAPAHIWHEVTSYQGEERTAIVLNLNVYGG
jgi:hypothetical protein